MRFAGLLFVLTSLIPLQAALAISRENQPTTAKTHLYVPDPPPRLSLSGTFWGAWTYDLANANPDAPTPNGANRFEVTRTYINVQARLTDSISLRITPDLTFVSNTGGSLDGSLVLRLKYAYLTFEDVLPGLSVRALMQGTPYIGFSDSIWGYRVLGSDALEFFTGMSSSDIGVGVLGSQLGKRLEYQVLLSNGEGYARGESRSRDSAKYKDIAARVTLSPFASGNSVLQKLRLSAFAQHGTRTKDVDLDESLERTRAMGLLTWQGPGVTLGLGGGFAWDDTIVEDETGQPQVEQNLGVLYTSWGWVNLPLNLRAIGRFDLFEPESSESQGTGTRTRLIAGLAYRFNDEVQVIADWQRYGYERGENAPETALGDALFLHLAADF